MTKDLAKLQQWIDESAHIVFFGGAGVSTESGIPDFRSVDGLYNQQYDYPPEEILSRSGWENVTAVRNNAILNLQNNELSRPVPRLADGAQMLFDFVYGE